MGRVKSCKPFKNLGNIFYEHDISLIYIKSPKPPLPTKTLYNPLTELGMPSFMNF